MAVVQAALLGLTAVLLAAQLKPLKPEYAVYLVLEIGRASCRERV